VSAMAELMETNELPDGWSIKPLGEVVSKLVDGSHNPPKKKDAGQMMLSARNIKNNQIVFDKYRYVSDEDFEKEHKRTRVTPGDVLLTIVGTIGRSAVVPDGLDDFTLQRSVAVITPERVLPKYLMYQFQAGFIQRYFEENARGTAQKGIYLKTLSKTPIRVAPKDQQERIVAEIEKQFSRLDEAVASLKRVKANLKRYKAAVLKAAVEGKLTEEWRKQNPDVEPASKLLERILVERRTNWEEAELAKMKAKGKEPKNDKWREKYKKPQAPKASILSVFPPGWAFYRTDQLFWFVTSGSRGWAKYYSDSGPIFLRVGNLDHDSISLDLDEIQHVVPPEGAEGLRTKVQKNDILVSITADVGMVAVIPPRFGEGYINQHISLARPVSQIYSSYLAWFLAAKPGQNQFGALQRGATKAGLGLDDIKGVDIPLPPVREQSAIVDEIGVRLSILENVEEEMAARFSLADRLRQSILQLAFSGGFGNRPGPTSGVSYVKSESTNSAVTEEFKVSPKAMVSQRGIDETVTVMKDLSEVLRDSSEPITPEKLFEGAGYSIEAIDDFYAALRSAIDVDRSIEELRPNDTDVLLKLVG